MLSISAKTKRIMLCLLMAVFLLSALNFAAWVGHECEDIHCTVCAMQNLQKQNVTFLLLSFAVICLASYACALVLRRACRPVRGVTAPFVTPISCKVKFSD